MHLKSKSEFNMEAAQVLMDKYDNFPSSVHCSYYGCFQFISHKLNQLGHTYEDVANAITASKATRIKLSTHDYPIKLIQKELTVKLKDDGYLGREVKDKMKLLKTFRTLSDYKNVVVDSPKGREALKISKEVLNIIKTKL